jgi:hypothetical protein
LHKKEAKRDLTLILLDTQALEAKKLGKPRLQAEDGGQDGAEVAEAAHASLEAEMANNRSSPPLIILFWKKAKWRNRVLA